MLEVLCQLQRPISFRGLVSVFALPPVGVKVTLAVALPVILNLCKFALRSDRQTDDTGSQDAPLDCLDLLAGEDNRARTGRMT